MSYGYLVINGQKIEIETWFYLRHVASGRDYILYVPTKPPRTPAWQPREVVQGFIPTTGKHVVMKVPVPAGCIVTAGTLPNLAARPAGTAATQQSPTAGKAPAAALSTVKLGGHSNQLGQVCRAMEKVLGLPRGTEVSLPFFKNLLHQANQRVFSDLVFDREDYGYLVRYTKVESARFVSDVKRQLAA